MKEEQRRAEGTAGGNSSATTTRPAAWNQSLSGQRQAMTTAATTTATTTKTTLSSSSSILLYFMVSWAFWSGPTHTVVEAWVPPVTFTATSWSCGDTVGLPPLAATARRRPRRRRRQQLPPKFHPLHHGSRQRDPWDVERYYLHQQPSSSSNDVTSSYTAILGSDEAGTGAWAGPVVAATVGLERHAVLDPNNQNDDKSSSPPPHDDYRREIRDSKQLTFEDRRRLFTCLQNDPDVRWAAAWATADDMNRAPSIQHAVQDALAKSIHNLVEQLPKQQPQQQSSRRQDQNEPPPPPSEQQQQGIPAAAAMRIYSIVDGKTAPKIKSLSTTTTTRPWKQADTTVWTVAAASIVARVLRDEWVAQQDQLEPVWQWNLHGGYSHPVHLRLLHQHGPQTQHRHACQPVQQQQQRRPNNNNNKSSSGQEQQRLQQQQAAQPHKQSEQDSSTTVLPVSFSCDRTATALLEPSCSSAPSNDCLAPLIMPSSRSTFFKSLSATSLALMVNWMGSNRAARAMYTDRQTGIRLPEVGEIAAALPSINNDDDDDDDTLLLDKKTGLSRLDSTPDTIFYEDPRFVEHVDTQAVQLLERYIGQEVLKPLLLSSANTPTTTAPVAVLDLCSSWVSHIPSDLVLPPGSRVAGLGLNAAELRANPRLTEWAVQDLNASPQLPYTDNSFQTVLCQLSIDYLTQPLAVCREIGRVLQPGGSVHILFSNRCFLTKAVALWTGADDIDHTYTVGSYLKLCQPNLFTQLQARDLSVRNKAGKIVGDPLYVVRAVKQ